MIYKSIYTTKFAHGNNLSVMTVGKSGRDTAIAKTMMTSKAIYRIYSVVYGRHVETERITTTL